MITALHLTTLEPIPGWPTCEKVVHENRRPDPGDYQEQVALQGRTSCTVQFVRRGRLRWRAGAHRPWATVGPGEALVYDAGAHGTLTYEVDPAGGHLEFVYANLIGEAMRHAVAGIVAEGGHGIPTQGEDLVERWTAKLLGGATPPAHRCLSVVESCELAWSFLLPLARGRSASSRLAERALALLTERWRDPPSLAALARQLQVSREHLSRLLRSACGEPPGLWLRRYRLARASDLLDAGRPLSEVARTCGYSSVPHFIAAFRRFRGTTPGRWLRERRTRTVMPPRS